MLLALTALDIDPESDERFQKADGSVIDALLAFRLADGSFAHQLGGQTDAMAGESGHARRWPPWPCGSRARAGSSI